MLTSRKKLTRIHNMYAYTYTNTYIYTYVKFELTKE